MALSFLEFEQPIAELEAKIEELGHVTSDSKVNIAEEIARRCASAVEHARLYRRAQEAIGLRDDFLAVAAHELKTPLTTLQLQRCIGFDRSDRWHFDFHQECRDEFHDPADDHGEESEDGESGQVAFHFFMQGLGFAVTFIFDRYGFIFDAHTYIPPFGITFAVGWYIDAGLHGKTCAGFQRAATAEVVYVQPQVVRGAVGEVNG